MKPSSLVCQVPSRLVFVRWRVQIPARLPDILTVVIRVSSVSTLRWNGPRPLTSKSLWDFRFSRSPIWRWLSSGIFRDIALMMEAASTSETSVSYYQTTRRNIPVDSHLHPFFIYSSFMIIFLYLLKCSVRLLEMLSYVRLKERWSVCTFVIGSCLTRADRQLAVSENICTEPHEPYFHPFPVPCVQFISWIFSSRQTNWYSQSANNTDRHEVSQNCMFWCCGYTGKPLIVHSVTE
jgi:hypothetical protein